MPEEFAKGKEKNLNTIKMTSFADLKVGKEIIDILNESYISEPTQIQIEVLKSFRNDLIVQSPTGTGKTLAYLIPIAEIILKNKNSLISSVILVPTRELAIQVSDVLKMLKIESTVLMGGTKEASNFNKVIVATPGRFNQVILNSRNITVGDTKISLFNLLKKLDFLILDEADKLLGLGFRTQLNSIIRQVKANRNALFSATINENISLLCKSFLKTPKIIKNEQKINLDIQFCRTSPFMKIFYLIEIFKKYNRIIVFFLTCSEVDYFTELFKIFGYSDISKIHGKMEQQERNKVYGSFKNILFGTDLASRGIDFKNIDLVVHFDIPLDPESFLHRSGRSARNNQKGKALLLITQNEEKYLNYLKIKKIEITEENNTIDLEQIFHSIIKVNKSAFDRENIDIDRINVLEKTDDDCIKKNLQLLINEELLKISVKAFVSHIAAYKEHSLKFLLDFKKLDFDSLANLHFLQKIPVMKELGCVKFKHFSKDKKN